MSWIGLALTLVRIVSWLIDRAEKKKQMAHFEAVLSKRTLEKLHERIQKSVAARSAADRGLRDDDPNLRD